MTKRVLVDWEETGIDHLDHILQSVRQLHLRDDHAIAREIMQRVKEFNYVPTKKEILYAEALLHEYRNQVITGA